MDQKASAGTRAEKAVATRQALIEAGRELFARRGYHAVGIREFAAAAGVTRGALYHHFGDKMSLFCAVFDAVHEDLAAEAAERHRTPGRPDRWTQLKQDLQQALIDATRPDVRRIVLIDGMSILGWARWRERGGRIGFQAICKALSESIKEDRIRPQPIMALATLVLAAKDEAALMIAYSDNPDKTRDEMGEALNGLLCGLE